MVTVKNVRYRHGYSSCDHLLDDTALQGLIGEEFRSVDEAHKAAARIERDNPQDERCATAPIAIEVILPDGSTREV